MYDKYKHRYRQRDKPKIENVLVVYNDEHQNLPKVSDSILEYYKYENCSHIKTLRFVNINELTKEKAKELMPISHNLSYRGFYEECRLEFDVIVFCIEPKSIRRHTMKILELANPNSTLSRHIQYSTIRYILRCRKGLF